MLRKYPDTAAEVIPPLQKLICESHHKLEDPEAKVRRAPTTHGLSSKQRWPESPRIAVKCDPENQMALTTSGLCVSVQVAGLFILGEFGFSWPDAPYVLEDICEHYEDEESPGVRMQMLNTTAKMFFQVGNAQPKRDRAALSAPPACRLFGWAAHN